MHKFFKRTAAALCLGASLIAQAQPVALPPEQVFTIEGGHDWPQWRQLWRNVLDVLPLPAIGRPSKQTITQSQVTRPQAAKATPWAIAA